MTSIVNTSITYRPIKIGFCIDQQNLDDLREAVKLSTILCGGGFNYIIPVHDKKIAEDLVKESRVDLLYPIRDTKNTQEFISNFPHLKPPYDMGKLCDNHKNALYPKALDILHTIKTTNIHEFKSSMRMQIYRWEENDPLCDIFLTTFGAYPDKEIFHRCYQGSLEKYLGADIFNINVNQEHPYDFFQTQQEELVVVTPYNFTRLYLQQHPFWQHKPRYYGFYVGDSTSFNDLVDYWNLRASGCLIFFYDPSQAHRFEKLVHVYVSQILLMQESYPGEKRLAWFNVDLDAHQLPKTDPRLGSVIINKTFAFNQISESWPREHINSPYISFSSHSVLGILNKTNSVTNEH